MSKRWLALPAAFLILLAGCSSGSKFDSRSIGSGSPTSVPPANVAPVAPTTPPSISGPPTGTCGSGGGGIGGVQRTGQRKFDAAPARVIDPDKTYVARMQTSKGEVVMLLAAKDVPNTTNNFVFLACDGFYDGLTFHRVVTNPPFVVQGGDPNGNGTGGPGYVIKDEVKPNWRHDTGALAMANAGPNTQGSQFYITLAPQPGLDGTYTVFGRVLTGMEVVRQIAVGDRIVRIDIEEH